VRGLAAAGQSRASRGGHCMRLLLLIAMGLLFLAAETGAAGAEKRVALLIGNGAYKAQRLLENPANDARLVSQALTAARFAVVDIKTDLGIGEFRQALRRFQSLSTGADVAFVYFAGHGMEVGGVNWLIPTDAELADDRDLEYEAIKIDLVLQALSGANLRVLVIDACRDNPFGRGWRSATRGTAAGLAKLEADDVLVLFAAAPGRTASDGSEGNSPFAKALARRLPEPGVPIQLLGGNVRDDVLAATNGGQRPYVSASITGRPFYLMPADPVKPAAQTAALATGDAAREWQDVKTTDSTAALQAFLERYSNDPVYGALAKDRIALLSRPPASSPTPAEAAPSVPRSPLAGPGGAIKIQGLKAELGDPIERVRTAYNIKNEPFTSGRALMHRVPLEGLFFFFDKDRTLYQVRMDAPFGGSLQGIRIDDPVERVLEQLGQPYTVPWDFGDNRAYVFRLGQIVLRYDIAKNGKVATMMVFPQDR
jgi:uncharacterized caspase-like protein